LVYLVLRLIARKPNIEILEAPITMNLIEKEGLSKDIDLRKSEMIENPLVSLIDLPKIGLGGSSQRLSVISVETLVT